MKPSELTDDQLIQILNGDATAATLEYEDTGPGKFEGNENPGLAQAIYERSLDTSWFDEETGTVEWYFHVGRLGRFLLYENDQGFVTLEEYPTTLDAGDVFDEHEAAYGLWDNDEEDA